MPNHFHWLFYVKKEKIQRKILREHIDKIEVKRRLEKYGEAAKPLDITSKRIADENSDAYLNEAIGILQKSYTRAINKEMGWSGSLFRNYCKAKDGWIDEFVTLQKTNGKQDFRFLFGTNYASHCLMYIHDNPRKAGLVVDNVDWNYSSAKDYAGLRKQEICNVSFGKELLGIPT